MKKIIFIMLIFFCTFAIHAEEISIALEKANIDSHDMASIKRGAKFFGTVCIACHTLKYVRYDPIAKEAGVTIERMPFNVKQWPFGIKPPDLSLEASYRGVDWIYTYLHSFYQDPSRPTGVNNLVLPNTAMSGILVPLQGQQIRLKEIQNLHASPQWYDVLVLQQAGSMTPKQFDETVRDVVNFLNYAANPYQAQQYHLGFWVLGFLIILFVLMYSLKQEYWNDVEKHKKDE